MCVALTVGCRSSRVAVPGTGSSPGAAPATTSPGPPLSRPTGRPGDRKAHLPRHLRLAGLGGGGMVPQPGAKASGLHPVRPRRRGPSVPSACRCAGPFASGHGQAHGRRRRTGASAVGGGQREVILAWGHPSERHAGPRERHGGEQRCPGRGRERVAGRRTARPWAPGQGHARAVERGRLQRRGTRRRGRGHGQRHLIAAHARRQDAPRLNEHVIRTGRNVRVPRGSASTRPAWWRGARRPASGSPTPRSRAPRRRWPRADSTDRFTVVPVTLALRLVGGPGGKAMPTPSSSSFDASPAPMAFTPRTRT